MPARSLAPEKLEEVRRRILLLQSRSQISRECAGLWDYTPRQVYDYISAVEREMARDEKRNAERGREKRQFIEAQRRAFEACMAENDFKAAKGFADVIARCRGFYEPEKHLVAGDPQQIALMAMTPEERKARILELLPQVFKAEGSA